MSCQQHKRDRGIWIGSYVWVFVQARRVFVWPRCQAAVFLSVWVVKPPFLLIRRSSELCVVCGTACAFLSVQCKLPYVCARVCARACVSFLGILPWAVGVSFCLLYKQRLALPGTAHCQTGLYTQRKRGRQACVHTPYTHWYTPVHTNTHSQVYPCSFVRQIKVSKNTVSDIWKFCHLKCESWACKLFLWKLISL